MELYIYLIALAMIVFAFRNKIVSFVNEWYYSYKKRKEHDTLMRRLYLNSEGKYNHKEYLKSVDRQKKVQRKKIKNKQDDLK